MPNLRLLADGRRERSDARYANAPPELTNFHRRYPLGALAAIMEFCGIKGSKWLLQFDHGFPIVGTLSQKFAFPLTSDKLPAQLPLKEVWASVSSRFIRRSKKPPPQAESLWEEATQQVRMGWMDPPKLLSDQDSAVESPEIPLNLAFRFAVAQTSKIRDCYDLKESLKNRLCAVMTPITLPYWDL